MTTYVASFGSDLPDWPDRGNSVSSGPLRSVQPAVPRHPTGAGNSSRNDQTAGSSIAWLSKEPRSHVAHHDSSKRQPPPGRNACAADTARPQTGASRRDELRAIVRRIHQRLFQCQGAAGPQVESSAKDTPQLAASTESPRETDHC